MTPALFSILVPTRGGAAMLPGCLDAVLADDGDDLELVVSDNANDDATPDILAARAREDPRVTVVRQRRPIDVTANWNATLGASTGQYVLMLGDDDLLLPGTLRRLRQVIGERDPDAVSYEGWMYMAPGTLPGRESAMYGAPWKHTRALFRTGSVNRAQRSEILRALFRFEQPMALTMATTLVARRMIDRLGGELFKPPFPDWYAHAALLARATRWSYLPMRGVVIGVSANSFSQWFNQGDYQAGFDYLGLQHRDDDPGSEMLARVVDWLELVRKDFGAEHGLEIDRSALEVRRVWNWIKLARRGVISNGALAARLATMSLPSKMALGRAVVRPENLRRAVAVRRSATNYAGHPWWDDFHEVDAPTIHAFGRHLQERDLVDRERPV